MSVSRRALKGLLMAVLVVGCIIAMPAAAEVVSPTEPPTEIPFGGTAPNVDDNASATPPPTEVPFGETAPNEETTVTETPTATEDSVGGQAVTETETPTETVTETETETPVSGVVVDNVSDDVPILVQPGEMITVGSEPQVYDFSGLRNMTGGEDLAITELRAYDNNNPETGTLANTVSLGSDDANVELSAADFGNTFGIYYPYDGQDVIDSSITVNEETGGAVGNETPAETMTTEETMTPETTETPAETMTTEETTTEMTAQPTFTTMQEETGAPTPTSTATPLSIPIVLAALGIFGLLIVMRRQKR